MCKRLFCCNKCRRRHEQKTHNLVYECAICRGDPLIIDPEKSESSPLIDLLEHVRIKHMPLHCNKCDKMYNSPEDLKPDLGKCERKENNICSLTDPISEYNIQKRQIRLKHIQESPGNIRNSINLHYTFNRISDTFE